MTYEGVPKNPTLRCGVVKAPPSGEVSVRWPGAEEVPVRAGTE